MPENLQLGKKRFKRVACFPDAETAVTAAKNE